MQDRDNNYLEIAVNYMNAGMWYESIILLSSLEKPSDPLVEYYLAWFYAKNYQPEESQEHLSAAGKLSLDYCFPYRKETIQVLEYAIDQDQGNAIPYYLLGNLLYDRRPEYAIEVWEKALAADENLGMVWRNLAFGAFHYENDPEKAIQYIKKAIDMDGSHAIWYAEMENYYDMSNADFRDCLEIMARNIDVVKQDITAPKSLVKLYNLNGEYDKAIDLLENHHFRTWEGGRIIYYHYVDAHTLKALELIERGNMRKAIPLLEKAMLYPENLEVGKPLNDERNAMIYYFLGKAYEKMKDKTKAEEYFKKSINAENSGDWPDLMYYQARSYEALGDQEKADKIYEELIEEGDNQLERGRIGSGIGVEESSGNSEVSISEAYYLKALGSLGSGNSSEAKELLRTALEFYKNNLWAMVHMQAIK
jgi:tetratricopeptide (TPR) repeat protein